MSLYNPIPTRIDFCKETVRNLVEDLAVPERARDLVSLRLTDNYVNLEEPVPLLKRRVRMMTILFGILVLVSCAAAALAATQVRLSSVVSLSIFGGALASIAVILRIRMRIVTELWLRTPVAQLSVAAELLELAYCFPLVRTYLECAVQLYDTPRGLDLLLARYLAKPGYFTSGRKGTLIEEQTAMRELLELPYVNESY